MSIEKLAKLKMKNKQMLQGCLFGVTLCCGMYLFATVGSEEAGRNSDEDVVTGLGFAGALSAGLGMGIEMVEIRRHSRLQRQPSGNVVENVESLAFAFIVATVCCSVAFTVFSILFMITLDNKWHVICDIIISISAMAFILGILFRPRDNSKAYKIFLITNFVLYACCSEICFAIGNFRLGKILTALSHILCLLVWIWGFRYGLKFRSVVGKFSDSLLSNFLCQNVLIGGIGAMAPMLFFSFETVSCLVESGFETGICDNTSTAAAFLSVNLAAVTALSLVNKAQQRKVQVAAALSYERLAVLDLKRRQIFQGFLISISGISSLFLLSNIGIAQTRKESVHIVGTAGFLTIILAIIIQVFVLGSKQDRREGGGEEDGAGGDGDIELDGAKRKFSAADIGVGMAVIDMV
ncbi:hypothetical protein TrLO_g9407 [Triparma laevis f. longispina]|uniref:Uncharacterized protein n=1 Tax=Triparma laevis f. longispina TaxID=1714387 RepID=A0A9W7E9C0_9STRA|nr:hypothetical protein TrLO_g9407 [Triparma laevis f. longispina]